MINKIIQTVIWDKTYVIMNEYVRNTYIFNRRVIELLIRLLFVDKPTVHPVLKMTSTNRRYVLSTRQ